MISKSIALMGKVFAYITPAVPLITVKAMTLTTITQTANRYSAPPGGKLQHHSMLA